METSFNKGMREYQNTRDAILLDVRDEEEYRSGHVPGSKNIPVYQLDKAIACINKKSTPIFVYCQSGSRSYQAVDILRRMGYRNVKSLGAITSYAGRLER